MCVRVCLYEQLKRLFPRLPDLERGLARLHVGRCSPVCVDFVVGCRFVMGGGGVLCVFMYVSMEELVRACTE